MSNNEELLKKVIFDNGINALSERLIELLK